MRDERGNKRGFATLCALGATLTFGGNGFAGEGEPRVGEIRTVQLSSYFSSLCGRGVAFDRLVVTPTVIPFVIPPGKVFVVLSIDWLVEGGVGSQARTAELYVETSAGFNGISGQSTAFADANGVAGASLALGPGIVVRPNEQLCLGMHTPATGDLFQAVAHGFLTSAH